MYPVTQILCTSVCALKIEMCELTAERHRLQEQLRSVTEQQQRTSNSLQQRITALQQERDAVQVPQQVYNYTHARTRHLNFNEDTPVWNCGIDTSHNHLQAIVLIIQANPKMQL